MKPLVVTLGAAIAAAGIGWMLALPPSGTVDVSVSRADAGCLNMLGADGSNWISFDVPSGDPIQGVFEFEGDQGTLVLDNGQVLSFSRSDKWGPCFFPD